MSDLARHMASMEASLRVIAERVTDFPAGDAALAGWFHLVLDGIANLGETQLAPHGLHQSDFRALMRLFSAPQGCAFPGELSEALRQTPANITRITDGLVARGWVERSPSAGDRRRVVLRITTQGRAFVRRALPQLFEPMQRAFACLNADEKRVLQDFLKRLVEALDRVCPA